MPARIGMPFFGQTPNNLLLTPKKNSLHQINMRERQIIFQKRQIIHCKRHNILEVNKIFDDMPT